ncbi:MAG: DUF1592 domain-containing protein [Planctomyces sp.]
MLRLSVPLPCCPLPCCRLFSGLLACCLLCSDVFAGEDSDVRTLTQARQHGLAQSLLLTGAAPQATQSAPQADLATFREQIAPVLQRACVQCHGPDQQEGNIRIDTLNPDLLHGPDVSWWQEVSAVVSKHEMPPPGESELSAAERTQIVEWLSGELLSAAQVQRAQAGQSAFRRMTRYEINYALQDLLGLPWDFAKDLPPEPVSKDGFQNSAELLQMSVSQLQASREVFRGALRRAVVHGDRPKSLFWAASMHQASADEWAGLDGQQQKLREQHAADAQALQQALEQFQKQHSRAGGLQYLDRQTGLRTGIGWGYGGAQHAWPALDALPEVPAAGGRVAEVRPGQRLIVELGDRLPDAGPLLVRVRAWRSESEPGRDIPATLQLEFGWQASNDSQASMRASTYEPIVAATAEQPGWYEWRVELSEIEPRNLVRGTAKMGETPSPSELLRIINGSLDNVPVQIDYVEVTSSAWPVWPPESHRRLLEVPENLDEAAAATVVLERFMKLAWRGRVQPADVQARVALFHAVRPECADFQEAILEVLASILASPRFLYLVETGGERGMRLDGHGLASRLSTFLWCSIPDEALLQSADSGALLQPAELRQQVQRMLADPRSERMSQQFVRQWLGLQLLDYLRVDNERYPRFDPALKQSMQQEPGHYFREVLVSNSSVLDFVHSDYAVVDPRLARHYGLPQQSGTGFRRVSLPLELGRGGLLTQAGLLAMNSDGRDSHPLKRGIWLLERILNDPPPPPPPAVPVIDLADPEILKLTLKQRLENHRSQPACYSCHARIDPWGIAFEEFDAVGAKRSQVQGQPVDAVAELYNRRVLAGAEGLKRYLLEERQDQFVTAIVSKVSAFALGRPLTFADRGQVDAISRQLRRQGDGLGDLIQLLCASELFQSR